jgi:hypothetical protein
VARFEIDPDRTQVSVGTRPGLPGLGASVAGVRGWFDATLAADGTIDLGPPTTGELTATVDRIETGNQLVADAMARWPGASSGLSVHVAISDVRPLGDHDAGRVEVVLHAVVGERSADLVGSGRMRALDAGAIEAAGVTLCDPRAFGISLPPLLNLIVHVRWRVTLVPAA